MIFTIQIEHIRLQLVFSGLLSITFNLYATTRNSTILITENVIEQSYKYIYTNCEIAFGDRNINCKIAFRIVRHLKAAISKPNRKHKLKIEAIGAPYKFHLEV